MHKAIRRLQSAAIMKDIDSLSMLTAISKKRPQRKILEPNFHCCYCCGDLVIERVVLLESGIYNIYPRNAITTGNFSPRSRATWYKAPHLFGDIDLCDIKNTSALPGHAYHALFSCHALIIIYLFRVLCHADFLLLREGAILRVFILCRRRIIYQ